MSCESHVVFYRNFITEDGEKGNLLFASLEAANECFPDKTISGDKCEPVGDTDLIEIDETSWRMLQEVTKQGRKFIEGYVPDHINSAMESERVTEISAIRCDMSKPFRVWFLNYKDPDDGESGSLLFRKRREAMKILKDQNFKRSNRIEFVGKPGMTEIHCINQGMLSRHRFIEGYDNSHLTPIKVRRATN